MQRTLVLVRHAKSSWANPLQSDYDRPLNERGIHDAPMMGTRLKEKNILPDLIISSTAKRAAQTAKKIAAAVGFNEENILWKNRLYHCIPSVIEEVIQEVSNEVKTVFLVAHNPGITEFVNELVPGFRIDNMPTCSMVGAHIDAEEWDDFTKASKEVFLFDYPKKQS
ncbi:SixA phosphatase family protein [Chitinophagaceae bacterium MMS25-I14]